MAGDMQYRVFNEQEITRHFEACLRRMVFATTEVDLNAITLDETLVTLGRSAYLYQTQGKRIIHLPRPDEHQADILRALSISFLTKPKISKRAKISISMQRRQKLFRQFRHLSK